MEFDSRRRSLRKAFTYPVFIDRGDGGELIACTFSDISETGARLYLAANDDLPEQVTLVLTRRGVGRRPCKIVWRSSVELGVMFIDRAKPKGPHQLVGGFSVSHRPRVTSFKLF